MPSVDGSKPSLDDAKARISRAETHIASLEAEITAVLPPDRSITAPIMGPAFLSGGNQRISAPPILPILIGETLYNLRGALDYLVYELFHLDTGRVKGSTKFPIEDTIESWNSYFPTPETPSKKRRKMWLHGLTPAHQAAIKWLQPCDGCKWTGVLRSLSNPDKHRRLTKIDATVNHRGHGAIGGFGPMMVTFQLTTKVAFENGAPVVETLKELQQQVADVIDAFDSEF
jgi:hypothetical protein